MQVLKMKSKYRHCEFRLSQHFWWPEGEQYLVQWE